MADVTLSLPREEIELLDQAIDHMRDHGTKEENRVQAVFNSPFTGPTPLFAYHDRAMALMARMKNAIQRVVALPNGSTIDETFTDEDAAYMLAALNLYTQYFQDVLEKFEAKSHNQTFLEVHRKRVSGIANLAKKLTVHNVRPMALPRAEDVVSLRALREHENVTSAPADPTYDEKFGLLFAPEQFLRNLDHWRLQCAGRKRGVAVGYVDIDNFKKVNEKHSETIVDRFILPRFMRAMEAFVFSRGLAYREGGDEYLVIVPNVTQDEAIAFFHRLRKELASLSYGGVDQPDPITVSIGFTLAEADDHRTSRQLQQDANDAKKAAKAQKNAVAIKPPGAPPTLVTAKAD